MWMSGCHFAKYYTKTIPKKPKDRTEEDKLAMAKEKVLLKNMSRIGECTMIIDPLFFQVIFYTVPEYPHQATHKPTTSYYRPAPQYSASSNLTFTTPYNPPKQVGTMQQPQTPSTSPAPTRAPVLSAAHPQSYQSNSQQQTQPVRAPAVPSPRPNAGLQPTSSPAPDPVIHMLAQRAGTDTKLKAVMKIVAAGKATPEQLQYFQGHIDELTNLLEARQKAAASKQTQQSQSPVAHTSSAGPPKPSTPVHQGTMAQSLRPPPTTSSAQPRPPGANVQQPQTYNRPTMPIKSQYQPPPVPAKPAFRHLYFEFIDGPGDRLYFPENTILEILPGSRQVRFSFIVIKPSAAESVLPSSKPAKPQHSAGPEPAPSSKQSPDTPSVSQNPTETKTADVLPQDKSVEGSSSKDPAQPTATQDAVPVPPSESKADKETAANPSKKGVYQCVTGTLLCDDYKLLDALQRAVRPPDEVRKYMNHIFDTVERAENRYLALRLPKSSENTSRAESQEADKENTPVESAAKRRRIGVK
jgi:hypothetical protein